MNKSSEVVTSGELEWEAVISRLKAALGVDSDSDLSRVLGLSRSDLANRKRRGTLPLEQIVAVAMSRNVNLNEVLFGQDPARGAGALLEDQAASYTSAGPLDVSLLETVLSAMRHELSSRRITLSPAREARVAALLYEHFSGRKADKAAFSRFLDVVLDR